MRSECDLPSSFFVRRAGRSRKGVRAPSPRGSAGADGNGRPKLRFAMSGDASSRLTKVAGLFGSLAAAAIDEQNGVFSIGYREGRDVCVIARGKTWEETF